jgi:hypothetical protein
LLTGQQAQAHAGQAAVAGDLGVRAAAGATAHRAPDEETELGDGLDAELGPMVPGLGGGGAAILLLLGLLSRVDLAQHGQHLGTTGAAGDEHGLVVALTKGEGKGKAFTYIAVNIICK